MLHWIHAGSWPTATLINRLVKRPFRKNTIGNTERENMPASSAWCDPGGVRGTWPTGLAWYTNRVVNWKRSKFFSDFLGIRLKREKYESPSQMVAFFLCQAAANGSVTAWNGYSEIHRRSQKVFRLNTETYIKNLVTGGANKKPFCTITLLFEHRMETILIPTWRAYFKFLFHFYILNFIIHTVLPLEIWLHEKSSVFVQIDDIMLMAECTISDSIQFWAPGNAQGGDRSNSRANKLIKNHRQLGTLKESTHS